MPNLSQAPSPIPFNKPYLTGRELSYIAEAHLNGKLAGDGAFTRRCQGWLEGFGAEKALLTHSCTAALEMAAILCDIGPGDEVILPSYTFVSTANAFVLRGATPVFVDIRPDTLNIDENLIEAAITPRTRAIVPVHYAGVACEMDTIMAIAEAHGLLVIEDAAQGCMATYKGRALGTIGHLGCYSFHETKNIISGEGGALLVNHPALVERAEIIREKGTDRSKFLRGEIDKYTWTDIGSSYLPGELTAAFLWAQMEGAADITRRRLATWSRYDTAFRDSDARVSTPAIPVDCGHNAHLYYLLNRSGKPRDEIIAGLKALGIHALFHYVPLHSSPYGRRCGAGNAALPVTDRVAAELIRLPLYVELDETQQARVIDAVSGLLAAPRRRPRTAAPATERVAALAA
jgi:dTDP-4-amino-4,6-dideoxygalactose transaminase